MFETFGFQHLLPFVRGVGVTLYICAVTAFLGILLGTLLGLAMTSKDRVLRAAARCYVSAVRGIPLLVILFSLYFTIPMMLRNVQVDRQLACVIGLTLYAGAYIGELVRGSIQAIPKGQSEAAHTLGMSYFQRMWFIILPQAVRLLIPPLVGFLINLVKDSSLVSVLNYIDLMRTGKIIGNLTMNPLLSYSIVAAFYFIICFSISRVAHYLERRLGAGARTRGRVSA